MEQCYRWEVQFLFYAYLIFGPSAEFTNKGADYLWCGHLHTGNKTEFTNSFYIAYQAGRPLLIWAEFESATLRWKFCYLLTTSPYFYLRDDRFSKALTLHISNKNILAQGPIWVSLQYQCPLMEPKVRSCQFFFPPASSRDVIKVHQLILRVCVWGDSMILRSQADV